MRPAFDERDQQILSARAASLLANRINVGDFVIFRDGTERRVSYVWVWDLDGKIESVQTSTDGSFYLGDGFVSFSGSLFHGIPFDRFTDTGERRDGRVWFFHHDYHQAHSGVDTTTSFRVWRCDADSTD